MRGGNIGKVGFCFGGGEFIHCPVVFEKEREGKGGKHRTVNDIETFSLITKK